MLTLKEWRRAKGISLENMAKLVQVSLNTYARWEREPAKIPLGKAYECARAIGVSINDIIFLPEQSTKCSTEQ